MVARLEKIDAALTALERQWVKLPLSQQDDWKFALGDHRDQLEMCRRRRYAESNQLNELEQNIAVSQKEMQEELRSPQSSRALINPARSNSSFFTSLAPGVVDSG